MKPLFQNPHIQTLYATYYPRPQISDPRSERFELEDGDFVDCVWYRPDACDPQAPVVVLFHGLTGSVDSPYILRTMQRLGVEGYRVVLMHFRGCSGVPNRLPRSYHSGDTADAIAWIRWLRRRYDGVAIFAVGFSLGGNMLLKLMGEADEDALPDAAVAVSAPIDLAACADRIDRGFSKLYQRHLIAPLQAQLLEKYARFDMERLIGLRRQDVRRMRSFWHFDDAYTAPIHGFDGVEDYYARASAKPFLPAISRPMLIVHAADDPFTGSEVIPASDEVSAHVKLRISDYGGHLGFMGGGFSAPDFWLFGEIAHFLSGVRAGRRV